MAAELGSVVGEHEKATKFVETVLQNARSKLDEAKVKLILMLSQGAQHQFDNALETVKEILEAVEEPLPTKIGRPRLKWELMYTR